MYEYIIFDLDATLADTKYGIMDSAEYALNKMGINVKSKEELYVFVGPTLWSTFEKYYNMTKEEQDLAVKYYREDYIDKSIYNCKLYDGVIELLSYLSESGIKIGIATAKPTKSAKVVLNHLGIDKFISFCSGSNMDGSNSKKEETISDCLKHFNVSDLNKVCMVGDSKSDGIGANKVGVDFFAVLHDRVKSDFDGVKVKKFYEEIGSLIKDF